MVDRSWGSLVRCHPPSLKTYALPLQRKRDMVLRYQADNVGLGPGGSGGVELATKERRYQNFECEAIPAGKVDCEQSRSIQAGDMPTEATFAKIDMAKDLLLCDVFEFVLDADKESRGIVKQLTHILLSE